VIRLTVAQGTEAWVKARLGIPTASCFDKIITPAKMEFSKYSRGYRNLLLAEWLIGESLDDGEGTAFMERGTGMESEARDYYELRREVDLLPGGFILRDDRRVGCSPDGLVERDGKIAWGVEMKCPSAAVHMGHLLDGTGTEYRAQIQGSIWLAETDHWDFLSYNPALPRVLARVHRDDVFITHLAKAMDQFLDTLDAGKAELEARGYKPGRPDEGPKTYQTLMQKLEASLQGEL
jgi:hypothetical protein